MDAGIPLAVMEWAGAVTGLLGAFLLSMNVAVSRYGWGFFLLSNVMWIVFGVATEAWGLVFMQVGFTLTSMNGVFRWILIKDQHR